MTLLNSIGFSIVAFLFVLGVMIFVHEFGHYAVAKLLGIRVDVFSLGFGRRMIGFRRGETDYRISLLPLGGYVKMAGENYDDELSGDPGEFMAHPKWHRFAVAIAGPLMNIALALIFVTVTFMLGIPAAKYLRQPAVIGSIAADSPAEQAGLQIQDTIVAIDGEPTETWQEVELQISISPRQELTLSIERDNRVFDQSVMTSVAEGFEIGTIGASPFIPFVVAEVGPDSPASRAGLQANDEIIQVTFGETTSRGFNDSADLINSSEGLPLHFEIRRSGEIVETTITPEEMDGRWRIGTTVQVMELGKYGFFESMSRSVERNYRLTALTFEVVGRIFTGRTSLKAMSGPIEIARFSGMAASLGGVQLLNFMALISLQLGIFNLMPIPILDGGVIALLGIEGLIRRDLSMRVKERIFQVGFVFLMLLMGVVIFNDLAKNLPILN
ncbi:MAG: RIP metalloprotease RseP [Acidobacteriota bacterium]